MAAVNKYQSDNPIVTKCYPSGTGVICPELDSPVLFEENIDGYLHKVKRASFTRRQDCPDVWEYNGGIYIINYSQLPFYNLSTAQYQSKIHL